MINKMISIEQFRDYMDQIIEEIPPVLLRDLNGGILLRKEARIHPESIGQDLFVMGEYHRQPVMGRFIYLYYGSFARVWGHLSEAALYKKIRKTLLHELRHHVESLAGEKGLEIEDAIQIAKYKNRYKS